jgi:low temperature requirement protein LtrA
VWIASSAVPVPARYGWWALALGVDLGTSAAAARHAVRFPPHASHLPERVGLFTLIWLGEALVTVMRGIQAQPNWIRAAAATALSGIALVCAVWWAYFNWTNATAHRHVRSRKDRRRLDVWHFAHVPLYLGLGLATLGVEHAVKRGGWHELSGSELGGCAVVDPVFAGDTASLVRRRPGSSACGAKRRLAGQ